mgnify:CR=1 FL=1
MKGAALATITGQIVSALLAVYYLFRPKSFRLKRVSFKPDAEILKLCPGFSRLLSLLRDLC